MIFKSRALLTAVGIAIAAASAPASAQMVEAKSPASVVEALKAAGAPAELKKDGAGDPLIVTGMDGRKMGIVFYGCSKNVNCTYVSFYFGLTFSGGDKKMTSEQVADWNMKGRFGRLAMLPDGSLTLKQEISLDKGGMSRALFTDTFAWFAASVSTVLMALK